MLRTIFHRSTEPVVGVQRGIACKARSPRVRFSEFGSVPVFAILLYLSAGLGAVAAASEINSLDTVTDVGKLLTHATGPGVVVDVRGFYAGGDGGGGRFAWQAKGRDGRVLGASAHNGVTVINPNREPPADPVTDAWFDPEKGGETTGCWVRCGSAVITPEQFGAKGDGRTNDQAAFSAMETFINQRGIARVEFGAGKTYLYGDQIFSGKADGASYRPVGLMYLRDCRYVELRGNGATLKLDPDGTDGNPFRVGSFDPETGEPADGPTTNRNLQAGVAGLTLSGVAHVRIENLEIDGSNEHVMLGGAWGDTGYQVPGNNLAIRGRTKCLIENVHTHHAVKDGLYVDTSIRGRPINGTAEFDSSRLANIHARNLRSEYNGRQGMSYTGGIGGVFENCDFNHTGKGGVNSAPRAGVDIEHGPIHQLNFINCRFINNNGCALVHDGTGHTQITCSGCILWGSDSWSLWNKEPSWVFQNCKIYGPSPNAAGTFYACLFQDKPYNGRTPGRKHIFDSIRDATFVDCRIRCDRLTFGWFGGGNDCAFIRCNFVLGDDGSRTPGKGLGYLRHLKLYDCTFTDDLEEMPEAPYSLPSIRTSDIRGSRVHTEAIKTKLVK